MSVTVVAPLDRARAGRLATRLQADAARRRLGSWAARRPAGQRPSNL